MQCNFIVIEALFDNPLHSHSCYQWLRLLPLSILLLLWQHLLCYYQQRYSTQRNYCSWCNIYHQMDESNGLKEENGPSLCHKVMLQGCTDFYLILFVLCVDCGQCWVVCVLHAWCHVVRKIPRSGFIELIHQLILCHKLNNSFT